MGELFSSLTGALSPFFLNPAFFIPGAALIASPIVIHLLNRLRFRRVQFAAMAFLLQSQKRNKRRILFEQLLLLLLRILIVLLIAALIARLILDPNQLGVLRGEKSHHLVLLDDSLSMSDRWGETDAFAEAKKTLRKLVEEGARRPGTQKLTVLLLSEPEQPFINGEEINEQMLIKLSDDLQTLASTHRSLNLLDGLDAARQRLLDQKAISRTLHVLSDFRTHDWSTQPALGKSIKSFEETDIAVNLVRAVPEPHVNLALTDLSGDLQTAAVNVPLRLTATIVNHSDAKADNLRLSVTQDGKKLPVAIPVDPIEGGDTASKTFEVVFGSPGRHQLEVALDADAVASDNARFLVVDLLDSNPVLLIDGNPDANDAELIADALAADPSLTGIAPLIQGPEFLRRSRIDEYRCIYLVNVGTLPADAILPLKQYVAAGGGLVWYVSELTDPNFFNESLYEQDPIGLFPVRLGNSWNDLPRSTDINPGPDMIFTEHPMFRIFQGEENPFVSAVHIDRFYPLAEDFARRDEERADGVKTIVTLRNGQPLMFEHQLGEGRIVTCLTSAGPSWNDWSRNPSFVILQLEMQKYLAKRFKSERPREVGVPIELAVSASNFNDELEITAPGEKISRLKMVPKTGNNNDDSTVELAATYPGTDDPGVYRVTLFDRDQNPDEQWIAYNVATDEADLELISDNDLVLQIGDQAALQSADDLDWIRQRDTQQEARLSLLGILFLVMLVEQFLAYRLSYHSRQSGVTA